LLRKRIVTMNTRTRLLAALLTGMVSLTASHASDIKVISANGMREVIKETTARYESETGNKLLVTIAETGDISKRILSGETYDVIMVPKNASDEFQKAGKITADQAPLIRVNFGLGIKADGPRPDISSTDGLRKTFLAANKVLITDPSNGGISGVHLMSVLDKLGITEQMKPKLILNRGNGFHAEEVVKGTVDMAVQAEHEIKCVKGTAFLDYPAEFQRPIVFIGSIGAAAGDAKAAKSYLAFIAGPEARPAIAAHCLTHG
jgi:molybdate transport system substrate-binding protein